jgi:hypothetical protein
VDRRRFSGLGFQLDRWWRDLTAKPVESNRQPLHDALIALDAARSRRTRRISADFDFNAANRDDKCIGRYFVENY